MIIFTSRTSPFRLCFHFPFATMVTVQNNKRFTRESQRSDVATGNAGWPSQTQTQTQTQRCGALRSGSGPGRGLQRSGPERGSVAPWKALRPAIWASKALSGMFRRSASPAIPHLKKFAAIPSVSLVQLGHTNRSISCHTNRSVKLPSFRHFQDQLLTTNKEKWEKMGLCFAMFVFLTFRGPLASHDSNPYPNRSRIARYNATKLRRDTATFWPILIQDATPPCMFRALLSPQKLVLKVLP